MHNITFKECTWSNKINPENRNVKKSLHMSREGIFLTERGERSVPESIKNDDNNAINCRFSPASNIFMVALRR